MNKRAILNSVKSAADHIETCHPFPALFSNDIVPAMMVDLFDQYALISFEFPKVLCGVGARLSSDAARLGIISNLWDEHGRGEIDHSHRAMLEKFINLYNGSSAKRTIQSTWQTRLFITGVYGICIFGTISEAVGALLFFEAVTPAQYRAIISWLKENRKLDALDLEFWVDHVEHDGDHVRILLDNTARHENLNDVELLAGISQARHLEEVFWSQFEPRRS